MESSIDIQIIDTKDYTDMHEVCSSNEYLLKDCKTSRAFWISTRYVSPYIECNCKEKECKHNK